MVPGENDFDTPDRELIGGWQDWSSENIQEAIARIDGKNDSGYDQGEGLGTEKQGQIGEIFRRQNQQDLIIGG